MIIIGNHYYEEYETSRWRLTNECVSIPCDSHKDSGAKMNEFKLTPYELKEITKWLEFVHKDVEHKLLEHFKIQGVDQLRSGQYEEAVDYIQEMHVKLSKGKK